MVFKVFPNVLGMKLRVVCMAWTGVAAQLLPDGQTVHRYQSFEHVPVHVVVVVVLLNTYHYLDGFGCRFLCMTRLPVIWRQTLLKARGCLKWMYCRDGLAVPDRCPVRSD